jgi:hypothetical protein
MHGEAQHHAEHALTCLAGSRRCIASTLLVEPVRVQAASRCRKQCAVRGVGMLSELLLALP